MVARAIRAARTAAAVVAALAALAGPARATVPHEVAIARGQELVNEGKNREALGPLEEALAAAPENTEALFYAGVAHARLGEYDVAEALLTRAVGIEDSAEGRFELGKIAALTGRCPDAEGLFSRAASLGADDATRRAADLLLESCRTKKGKRPYRLSLTVGWQHDSNVQLDPVNPVAPRPGGTADDRAIAYFTAGTTLLRTGAAEVGAGYALYASFHKEFKDYNALYHKLSLPISFSAGEFLRPSLGYTLEYTTFDGDGYNLTHTVLGTLGFVDAGGQVTEAVVENHWSHFWDSDLFTDNAGRTGSGWSAGLRHRVRLGRFDTSLHGFYDHDDAKAKHWTSSGGRVGANVSYRLIDQLALGAGFEYQTRNYAAPIEGYAESRVDRTWQYSGNLVWTISRRFSAAASVTRTVNESTVEPYAYHRTVFGLLAAAGL